MLNPLFRQFVGTSKALFVTFLIALSQIFRYNPYIKKFR